MIVGLSVQTFTMVHVAITLIAIASGLIVVFGMIGSHRLPGLTALFLLMTLLSSVTGFMFPFTVVTPALALGVIAMVVLAVCLLALYVKRLYGAWRWIYVATAVISLYLNVFVLIVQSFEKLTLINPAAPVVGPPFAEPQNFQFAVTQGAALVLFVMLGLVAAIKFRRGPGLI